MFLIFDTETTGFPAYFDAPFTDLKAWESARLVQLAWQLHDSFGNLIEVKNYIIKPEGFDIPFNAEQIHGISTDRANKKGVELVKVLEEFNKAVERAEFNVGHNINFDVSVLGAEYYRKELHTPLHELKVLDTMKSSVDFCAIPGGKGGKFKFPKLNELHEKLFGDRFDEAHNAAADVEATARSFFELIRIGVFNANDLDWEEKDISEFRAHHPNPFEPIGLNIQPYNPIEEDASEVKDDIEEAGVIDHYQKEEGSGHISSSPFFHIHNHTQFSILQSTSQVTDLVTKAREFGMPAVAFSDHGNLFAAFQFVRECNLHEVKGIVGIELNICKQHEDRSHKDNGYGTVLLAKNHKGYKNLVKLSSRAYTHGFYYVPRIDKEWLLKFKDELIVTTGGVFAEVPSLILNVGEKQAEEAFLWWKKHFGDDFYVEINRHGLPEEERVNATLIKFARKYDVKLIASNNTYYLNKQDANAHDILLCVKDGELQSTPKKYTGKRGRDYRFGFPNEEFYFKSQQEMRELFADLPEAIDNLSEVLDKISTYDLQNEVLLPKFDIPPEFAIAEDLEDGGNRGENNYLKYLTYEGAKKRYGEITDELRERLDFELSVIENTGYPGYFLIVQDFTNEARKMGVSVGPGRGSAAGSAVAYCIGITNVDPIKYDLLFERFLNPERVSLPDIDIDFDDRGRDRIIDWVVNKYGAAQVAQIITYGSMAAKSSIRDTARVLDLPLPDADRIAKLIPNFVSLQKIFKWDEKERKQNLQNDQYDKVKQLVDISLGDDLMAETIKQARVLEGSVRNTGIHACGVIITPTELTNLVPIATSKDAEMVCTQFDNNVVESAGLLKMDFLGLKTLTIIDDAIALIKQNRGEEIVADDIPLDDSKTYELFQNGDTIGIFQYESDGMQNYLKQLKPDKFDDLIAMNALYRPGPLAYIPSFVKRKHGKEEIVYDLDDCAEYLESTYGITVYQEQVMLLSQKLAGFSKGQADMLRKAMGKKKKKIIDEMYPQFLEGCLNNGHPQDKIEKIWKDWEAFASYAFNKSHSTCYALLGYQTAYLKANYPAEFMAALLSNNMDNLKSVTKFMDESKRIGIPVLGPCVNESDYHFTVNQKGEVRFGLGAIKGVGENAVESIVNERAKGRYEDAFDLVSRVDLKAANKKTLEHIITAGAFDTFNVFRCNYVVPYEIDKVFLDDLIKYGNAIKANENRPPDLFGDAFEIEIKKPQIPEVENPWSTLEMLIKEKEVIGIYVSGHPLDDYTIQIRHFARGNMNLLNHMENFKGKEMKLPGMITNVEHRVSKNGNPFGSFELEDYVDSNRFMLFGEDYLKLKHFLIIGNFIMVTGRVQPRRYNETEMEFKISQIELLAQVMDKMTKQVTIKISLNKLNDEFLNELRSLIKENKGKCHLKIEVIDNQEQMQLSMPSRTLKVEPSTRFIQALESLDNVKYSLN